MAFLSEQEIAQIGFKSVGKNVLLSDKASIYGASSISIGNNVRIDDFCILSGDISIGNYVHISAYTALYGRFGIRIGNYCGISPRSIIFSASDDFSGEHMISPMVPNELTQLETGVVTMCDFSQLGTNSVIMPGVTINQGAVTGANTLVLKDLSEWTINFGIPCKYVKKRSRKILELVKHIK